MEVLREGTVLFPGAFPDVLGFVAPMKIGVRDDYVISCKDAVMIRDVAGGAIVTRASLAAACPPVVAIQRDDKHHISSVRWVHDPGKLGIDGHTEMDTCVVCPYSLLTSIDLRPGLTVELFRTRGWFDEDPSTLSPHIRDQLLEQYHREIRNVSNKSVRRHVWLLAWGLSRWMNRLKVAYEMEIPTWAVLESMEAYMASTGTASPFLSRKRLAESEVTLTDENSRAYQLRKQAAGAAKRLRKANRNSQTSVTVRGWAALESVAIKLERHGTAFTPEFTEYLHRINTRFSADNDYSDSSSTVQNMLKKGQLKKITSDMLLRDEQLYRTDTLEGLYRHKVASFAFKGMGKEQLQGWLAERAPQHAEAVMDLMTNGQRVFMQEDFVPNGFKGIKNNSLYESHKIIHEDNAVTLWEAGKAILLPYQCMAKEDLAQLMGYKVHPVPKFESVDRIVTNMSYGTDEHPSYNDRIDWDEHFAAYLRDTLVTLRNIADIVCRMKCDFPHAGFLHAAVIDAKGAYEIFPLSFDKCKLVWSMLDAVVDGEDVRILKGAV